MSFKSGFKEELVTVSGLASKVFPLVAPKLTVAPYLVYQASNGLLNKTLDGYLSTRELSCEVNIIAKFSEFEALKAAVIAKIVSFIGRTIGTSGILIQDVTYEEPVDLYESEADLYRCNIEFKFYF